MDRFELTLILNPGLSLEDAEKVVAKVESTVAKNKGRKVSTTTWGIREFAQPIKKKSTGYYYFLQFDLTPSSVDEVAKSYFYERPVLRYLLVNLTKDKTYFKQLEINKQKKKDAEERDRQKQIRDASKFKEQIGSDIQEIARAMPRKAKPEVKVEETKTETVEKVEAATPKPEEVAEQTNAEEVKEEGGE